MNIYPDDDSDSDALIGLLQQGGHKVTSPRSAGTSGMADKDHLSYAASHDCVLLTSNARDFIELHKKWMTAGKKYPGILIVYKENNPARDMTFQQIASTITKIEQSGLLLE